MTPDRNPAVAGRMLGGRYVLLSHIAQGGMGEVWKARDRTTGQMVAAKLLRPELSGEHLSLSRLRIEADNAMRIHHPNVANVLDSGEDSGRGWIVMELIDGRPLTAYLSGGKRLDVQHLLPLLMQMAMALGAAEEAGVVHRDVKPANVLVRMDGMAKLTDFGISRTTEQVTLTADGMVMGTAQYLPPEQAMGEDATHLGDLYALGVIAYEAVVGRRPFTGQTQVDIAFSHVNDPVPPLPSDVPQEFADVVMHLLSKDPMRRPESGTSLARELMTVANQLGIDIAPTPLPEPEGSGAGSASTGSSAVAPVRHEKRTHLDAELLAPVDMDVEAPDVQLPPVPSRGSAARDRTRADALPTSPKPGPRMLRPNSPTGASSTPPVPDRELTTKYNRSRVARTKPGVVEIILWVLIICVLLGATLALLGTIHTRFGNPAATISAGLPPIEEVTT
ncbi:serine/threonine protein kinase [Schaalia sp. 19OD2882]|uniref:serine/threonine-protein kinase n=1 Tax=Schaalia sp. 19OD2882 TaxID=2794089 RepID=UPI001C1EFEB8|nr:serine/threonine-protein kinase [Schaalia sp. 19OD2882]QWW19614.1 serine/threonine protein kinase [Schaalia sp. 19OD2882]